MRGSILAYLTQVLFVYSKDNIALITLSHNLLRLNDQLLLTRLKVFFKTLRLKAMLVNFEVPYIKKYLLFIYLQFIIN